MLVSTFVFDNGYVRTYCGQRGISLKFQEPRKAGAKVNFVAFFELLKII